MSSKAQSAIEYLTTYGWAILILAVVAVALFTLINFTSVPVQACIVPAGLSCNQYYLNSNGVLEINLVQATGDPIAVTALGCSSPQSLSYMQNVGSPPSNYVYMPTGSNHTFYVECYSNSTAYTGKLGGVFSGYLIINYTNAYTQFTSTVYGKVSARVSSVGGTIPTSSTTTSSTSSSSSTSTSSSSTTTTSIPPLPYAYGGGSGYTPIYESLSGESEYFCGGSVYNPSGDYGTVSASYSVDQEQTDSAGSAFIGRTSSGTCELQTTTNCNECGSSALSIIGINTASYTLEGHGTVSGSSFSYSSPGTSTYSIILIATPSEPDISLSLPSGCTQLNHYSESVASSYLAICSDQSAGTYTVTTGTSSYDDINWAVYQFT